MDFTLSFYSILIILQVILLLGVYRIYFLLKNKETNPPKEKIKETIIQPLQTDSKQEHLFPIKLQAYERVVLFMERIEPSNLVMRTKTGKMTASQLHSQLLQNIREEYEHNVSQQIYISENAWNLVKQAKEETINILNMAGNSVDKISTANDLTRNIFEKMMILPKSPSQIALEYLKAEIKQLV